MEQMLEMLKVDLGITTTAYDPRLTEYLEKAMQEITREGATLNIDDIGDAFLVEMYAAWMWRRRDIGAGMPRMIRFALNNRVFAEKMGE